jgi:hypothetical protein
MFRHLVSVLAISLSFAAGVCACGEPTREAGSLPGDRAPWAEVAGMRVAEGDLLLREPVLATFCGGGTPPPPEPIDGLDEAVAKAFPEQSRGSSHPWCPAVVELLAPASRTYLLRLDPETIREERHAPLWSEPIELAAAERCVLVFAVRRRERGSRDVALRRVVVRSREEDGVWRVTGTDVRDGPVPMTALPAIEDTEVHGASFSFTGGHVAVSPHELPYQLGVWLWLPPPTQGRSIRVSAQPYLLEVDGMPYSSASSRGHAFWALVLSAAP